jgi:3-oxoacyl-[acyl-carrier protein] reductase
MTVDNVAVVTGAAQGMGAASARRLAQDGALVLVADLDEAGARACAQRLIDDGLAAEGIACDVSDEASVEEVGDHAVSLGTLRSWVNNAGITTYEPLLDIAASTWDRVMAVNARGTFFGVRTAARRMDAGAAIVNITSLSALGPYPDTAHYGASKGAAALLTQHAALELGPQGIRVNAVAPGTVHTAMAEERLMSVPGLVQRLERRTPLRRLAQPDDIARVVAFLCSDAAAFVHGVTIPVDGGWLLT